MLRIVSRIGLLAVLCSTLAACFQPVYGPRIGGASVADALAQIDVPKIEGHLGHQIKSELDFVLTNGTPPVRPVYRLSVSPKSNTNSVIVDVATGRPQISTYFVSASYSLTEIDSGRLVTSGTAQASASFDRNTQRFANVRAQRDAEIRTAKQIAEQIRARILPTLSSTR